MFLPLYDRNPLEHIRRPYVNWLLIALNVLVFVLFESGLVYADYDRIVLGAGLVPVDLLHGPSSQDYALVPAWASLVTYAFLHADWLHLGGNMLFLWVFGDNIEDAVGHLRYLAFYLLSAIAGGLVYALVAPSSDVTLIGASGAVAGVIAAYLILHPHTRLWVLAFGRLPLKIPALWPLLLWAMSQFYYLVFSKDDGIAWWDHVGGMAAGALLILVLRRSGVALFDRVVPPTDPV
ncbi:rhomboid family intramembrane serine protease [Oryzibacter oryziterrae]|uniref:rhomboid family intramembrane serine protease n=1 Tax=Oryzibacter oryziterrae TaxID=2766474 RepID=UPI001F34F181|nr:rhomboid family intramembrane serine protease [Oryzibacter oryziterrae]